MEKLFLQVFNLSVIACVSIVMVVVARVMLGCLPKWCSYLLWLGPAYLLTGIKPFASRVSFDLRETVGQRVTGATFSGMPDSIFHAAEAAIPSLAPQPYNSINPVQVLVFICANLWIVGMLVMLLYSLWAAVRLRMQLHGAQSLGGGIYLAHSIRTPFVMGIVKPSIYLPTGIADGERDYILLHERTHIRRCDHIIKPLAFLLLCVHWFNPLCWVAFYLMLRDMEMSCDEAVIKRLGSEVKQPYASSLLALAAPRSILCGSPLAFGEGHAGRRIRNLLDYKKPALWAMVVAVIAVVWLLVGIISRTPYADDDWLSQMYACKTDSVVADANVDKLAKLLPPVEDLKFESIKLEKTERGGYRATVFYEYDGPNPDGLSPPPLPDSTADAVQHNAVIILALTPKAETVYMSYNHTRQSGESSLVMTRSEATRLLGYDPADRSSSLENFRVFYNELQAMRQNDSLSTAGAGVVNYNGSMLRDARLWEVPTFELSSSPDTPEELAAAFADAYLSYYSAPRDSSDWLGHSVTSTPWVVTGNELSSLMLAVQYDMELRNDLDEIPTDSFLTNDSSKLLVQPDGRKLVTDNLLYLTAQQVDETHYSLQCVTRYGDVGYWEDSRTLDKHGVAQALQNAALSVVDSYRAGGINVHTTLGEGFAPVPLSIIWQDYNSIMLQHNASDTWQASVSVDGRYKLVVDILLEGVDLKTTAIGTRFVQVS